MAVGDVSKLMSFEGGEERRGREKRRGSEGGGGDDAGKGDGGVCEYQVTRAV